MNDMFNNKVSFSLELNGFILNMLKNKEIYLLLLKKDNPSLNI